ncbi:2-oxoacid:ferredoxin oxidoreductase subunit beta [Candidatus Pacearchaeota archaeon]|nr:MAG: 2-oxoacid:ferredoxin oxidoreductase subunit beta [Candidatus Pacearchaeota archaeon]
MNKKENIQNINKMANDNLNTGTKPTWCPGCYNFQILAGLKNAISRQIENGKKREDFAIVSGIGCHAKIFDYININGINTLHGRVLPACLGIKIGNPNLSVLGFAGDGDAYAEGISHLIHAARYNSDLKYIVHNNQVFALTVGQPTPTTELGFKDKTTPQGVKIPPLNPIKLMLASGATFIARVFADAEQVEFILQEALKHKGFAFIEILQPCLIFHADQGYRGKVYSLDKVKHDKMDFEQAWKKAQEFDYNNLSEKTRIPLGIFYQKQKPIFEEQFPQLADLIKKKIGWRNIKR